MTTFVALLRGINVLGRKGIRIADLKESLAALGHREATAYLQSGNVVFDASRASPKKLASAITARIAEDFRYQVEVLVMPSRTLDRIVDANPLRPSIGAGQKLFHCTFLFGPVAESDFGAIDLPAQTGEQARLVGQAVFLYCPHGYGKTKLNNAFFEKTLRVPATTRNWRTVLALQKLCAER